MAGLTHYTGNCDQIKQMKQNFFVHQLIKRPSSY